MRKQLLLLACLSLPAHAADLGAQLDAAIHPDDLRGWMKQMASLPNQVGSAHDKVNADYELNLFRQWGWDAHIETFEVLYPTPISETLETTGANPFHASLQEPPVPGDPTSSRTQDALPAYVAFQGDGDVTAPLVYVNYGMQDDYKALARMGVDVRGRIVIARYGKGWRGLKPKLAQDHGAIGCLIYSDPADDGYGVEKTYPDGPARPSGGIQRGSVADMPLYPGDPLTPGVGAVHDAKRLTREQATTILKIPVLPISYGDAQHFLAMIEGPVVPEGWRGALPITYHAGPGGPAVHLAVKSEWSLKPIYDVIATLRGRELPDEWVIRGNHHDGWVFGASDPLSGQVALMAEAQAIGGMARAGYKPRRTIIYTSWDAEEPMLVGSTEWVETHAAELKRHALIYINSDGNARGVLSADGSPEFAHVVNEVAGELVDPETKVNVGTRLRASLRVEGAARDATPQAVADAKRAAEAGQDFPIGALGSGSDFSPFLQHLGLAALDLGYAGEGEAGGVYHSAYDTFEHHSRFVDPGFVYDALLARTVGRVVLKLADADVPQQHATEFAREIGIYVDEVEKLAETERQEAKARAALLADQVYLIAGDPTKPGQPPEALSPVPFLEFAPLENASARLTRSAQAYDAALAHDGAALPPEKAAKLSALMLTLDQTLAPDDGLPGRPWYKNLIYAPGRFTGYRAKTLPGVREAIEERRWADANHYALLTGRTLDAYATRLDQARTLLTGAEPRHE